MSFFYRLVTLGVIMGMGMGIIRYGTSKFKICGAVAEMTGSATRLLTARCTRYVYG